MEAKGILYVDAVCLYLIAKSDFSLFAFELFLPQDFAVG